MRSSRINRPDSPNTCLQQTPAPPALMPHVSTPESTWCERQHDGKTPTPPHVKRDLSPGLHLGSKAPSRTLLSGITISTRSQCNTLASLRMSSGREPRAVSFTSSVQSLREQNPNVCSCRPSCYPDGLVDARSCAASGVRPDGQHAPGQPNSAQQNKMGESDFGFQPNHCTDPIQDYNLTKIVQADFLLFSFTEWSTETQTLDNRKYSNTEPKL